MQTVRGAPEVNSVNVHRITIADSAGADATAPKPVLARDAQPLGCGTCRYYKTVRLDLLISCMVSAHWQMLRLIHAGLNAITDRTLLSVPFTTNGLWLRSTDSTSS